MKIKDGKYYMGDKEVEKKPLSTHVSGIVRM